MGLSASAAPSDYPTIRQIARSHNLLILLRFELHGDERPGPWSSIAASCNRGAAALQRPDADRPSDKLSVGRLDPGKLFDPLTVLRTAQLQHAHDLQRSLERRPREVSSELQETELYRCRSSQPSYLARLQPWRPQRRSCARSDRSSIKSETEFEEPAGEVAIAREAVLSDDVAALYGWRRRLAAMVHDGDCEVSCSASRDRALLKTSSRVYRAFSKATQQRSRLHTQVALTTGQSSVYDTPLSLAQSNKCPRAGRRQRWGTCG